MRKTDEKKICFAASSGGHFEQLMMLKPLMQKYTSFIVTEETVYKVGSGNEKTYYLKQINRKEHQFVVDFLQNSIRSLKIIWKERPRIIITTGVLAIIPLCLLGKMFGARVIYIESFAKVTSPTITGKLLYKFADRFYVQWPEMKKIYPKAIYMGSIY